MEKSQTQMRKQSEETSFLKQLNTTLIENQKQFKTKLELLEKQHQLKLAQKDLTITNLQEEVKDLYTHLETQSKIEKNPEMEGGSVVVIPRSPSSPRGKKKKDTPKKKKSS